MSVISYQNVNKTLGGVKVLTDFSLDIQEGEFVVFIGPSGAGKTTALEMINGMAVPDTGYVRVADKLLSAWDKVTLRRSIGYCVQGVALFPNMRVVDNITFVLELLGTPKAERLTRAQELLALVGLDASYAPRFPHELSGGEAQRIGVARALCADPGIILMDEPFAAVDNIMRTTLQNELLLLHRKLRKTFVFVTHDLREARRLATRIAILHEGRLAQYADFDTLQNQPASPYVSEFIRNGI